MQTTAPKKQLIHAWELITYPSAKKSALSFLVGYGDKSRGLRVDVNTSTKEGDHRPTILDHVSARLHRLTEKGEQISEWSKAMSLGGFGHMGFVSWGSAVFLPWATNDLEDAWIEVVAGEQRFWLELPYGFSRNPYEPLGPPTQGDTPKLPHAIKNVDDEEHVLSWEQVQYSLGKIQNGWGLSLIQRNPCDGRSELVLYREDSRIGKSSYLWDLHSPRTRLRLRDPERVRDGFCLSLRLHEDGMRRSDTYTLWRIPSSGRCWGQLEIGVGGQTYHLVLPSSLYKYRHGHASEDEN